MKVGSPVTLRAGDLLYLASKHTHRFTCELACKMFDVTGDAVRRSLRGRQRQTGCPLIRR